MAHVQRSRRSRNADLVHAAACAHTRKTMKLELEILRQRPRQAGPREGRGPRGTGLPVEGLQRCRPAPRAQRPWARGRVLPALPRARAAVQCLLQLLPGHEQRRHRGLPEGQRHGPPADLEGRRQRVGARHAPRHGAYGQPRPALLGSARVFLVALGPSRRRRAAANAEAAGAQVARIPQFERRARPATRSRRGSRSWSNATTPTPMGGTKGPRTSCAKSSKLITISSRLDWSEACQPSSSE